MPDRMYRPNVNKDTGNFPVKDVGHLLSMGGIMFVGGGKKYLCALPGNDLVNGEEIEYCLPTPEQWEAIIRASDDPQYLDSVQKVWLRKAQRSVSGLIQQKVWARDGFKCMYCGRTMGDVQLSVDHFIPLELGGKDEPGNYISACRKCNKDKGKLPPREWCRRKGLDFLELGIYLGERGSEV